MPPLTVEPVESEETDPKSAPAPSTSPQIQYESAASPISRRQFRLLFLLTIVNTFMLFLFVAGPIISRTLSGWSQDYKQWQSNRAAAQQKVLVQQKFAADFQTAKDFSAPESQLVYEEDPVRAAALLAKGSQYAPVRSGNFIYITPAPWQLPAIRRTTDSPSPFQLNGSASVFLHARKSADGTERVVLVEFLASESLRNNNGRSNVSGRYITVNNQRAFITHNYQANSNATLDIGNSRTLEIAQPNEKCTAITWIPGSDDRWETGQVNVNLSNVFRLFAGQADPKDASHFTITYELDGKPGIIDGWLLNDGTVALEPRLGRIINDDGKGLNRRWDPYAVSPGTRPIVPPDLPPYPAR